MDLTKLKVTETRRIIKYNDGDLENPFEIVEKAQELEGEAALQLLKNLGVIKEDVQDAIN